MLLDLPLTKLTEKLKTKEVSSVEVVTESLDRITAVDDQLNSFITVRDREEALAAAQKSDDQRTEDSPPLAGIPFALKDAFLSTELRTTAASKVLETFTPPYNATVYNRLREQGAILVGKNNHDAWGHGGSTENTDFGPSKNPWDTTRTPGGSSGGTAAAVAARLVAFGIGEDTGGSIRNPANYCNISGLKVTYGRVSRYGTIAYASSLDTVGPMAKTVEDLAVLLEIMAGADSLDASSSVRPVDTYQTALNQELTGSIIGLPAEFFAEGLDPEVKALLEQAASVFERLGARLQPVNIPLLKHSIPIYYLIALSETSSNLARYDGIRYGTGRDQFTSETKRRIMLGSFALSAGYADELYKKAQQARTVLIQECAGAFESCDVLLAPTTPSPAPEMSSLVNDPLQNMLTDLYTVSSNVTGTPSLAIPAGFTQTGLPVGMQLMGPKFSEAKLLQFGHQYQQATDWHTRAPQL